LDNDYSFVCHDFLDQRLIFWNPRMRWQWYLHFYKYTQSKISYVFSWEK